MQTEPTDIALALIILGVVGLFISFAWLLVALSLESSSSLYRLPYATEPRTAFKILSSRLEGISKPLRFMQDGYDKYSKNGKAFILPNAHQGDVILISTTDIRHVVDAPEAKLSSKVCASDLVQAKWTTITKAFWGLVYDSLVTVVKTDVTRRVLVNAEPMIHEIQASLQDYFGSNECEWREVGVHKVVNDIVNRIILRDAVGVPLCRNEDLLHHLSRYTEDLGFSSNLVKTLPFWIRPVIAPLVSLPNRWREYQLLKYLAPVVEERIKMHHESIISGVVCPRDDMMQDIVKQAYSGDQPRHWSARDLAYRFVLLNVGASFRTSNSIMNTLLDLICNRSGRTFYDDVYEEANEVYRNCKGVWRKRDVDSLAKLDACCKESLRLHWVDGLGPHRRVMDSGGTTLPSGLHVPQGATLALPLYSLHRDESFYSDANTYNPLRHYNPATKLAGRADSPTDPETLDEMISKQSSMITTSDNYLAFSHGRHACPGRFIAQHIMKLMLSQMALRYEIDSIPERPITRELGRFRIPDLGAKIKVRRRSDQVNG